MKEFDAIVVGAGISGAAAFYTLTRFTNLKSIALLEKYNAPAMLNSRASSNSQTIHCGDIETNYSFEKAKSVKINADMVVRYAKSEAKKHNTFAYSHQKMALAVGDEECAYMKKRFEKFKGLYEYVEFWDKKQLKKLLFLLCKTDICHAGRLIIGVFPRKYLALHHFGIQSISRGHYLVSYLVHIFESAEYWL